MSNPTTFSWLNSVAGIVKPIAGAGEIPMASPSFNGVGQDGQHCLYLPKTWSGTSEYAGFTDIYGNNGTMIVRIKPNGWNFSGTTHSAAKTRTYVLMYKQGWSGGNAGLHELSFIHGTGLAWYFNTPSFVALTVTSADNAVSDGVWTEFELVWERGRNPSMEIYKNGILIGSANNTIDDATPIARVRTIGSENFARTDHGLEGWCDRFQHYPRAIRDFTRRNDPRFGMNDQRLII